MKITDTNLINDLHILGSDITTDTLNDMFKQDIYVIIESPYFEKYDGHLLWVVKKCGYQEDKYDLVSFSSFTNQKDNIPSYLPLSFLVNTPHYNVKFYNASSNSQPTLIGSTPYLSYYNNNSNSNSEVNKGIYKMVENFINEPDTPFFQKNYETLFDVYHYFEEKYQKIPFIKFDEDKKIWAKLNEIFL